MKITRKKFIKKMGLTIANSLLTGLSFPNCFIDMEYSPFQTNVTHSNLNQLNLMMIKQIEQSKG